MKLLSTPLLLAGLCFSPSLWAQAASPTLPPTLGLQQAISKTLQSSPALAAGKASLMAAQGNEYQAGLLTNPELGMEVANIAGKGAYSGTQSAEYTYSMSQKLELGGKRASRHSIAGAEREATNQALQATARDVIRDVTIAYGAVLAETEKLKLAEARENLAREVLANVSQRVTAARDPLIYRSQAEVSLATATLERQKSLRDLQLAKRKLASLWGEGALSSPLDAMVLENPAAPQPLEAYQTQLANTPDLQRFQTLQIAREAAVKLEKSQNIPDPSVSVGIRDFRETGSQAMVVGISMPIPVFNRNQGNISRAQAGVVQAEQEARQAHQAAAQNLDEAWQEWQSASAEAQQLQAHILPSAQQALTLSRQGYGRGRFSLLEVLTAQRTLAEAQEQHVNARQRQFNAKAIVERLTATSTIPATLLTGDTQ